MVGKTKAKKIDVFLVRDDISIKEAMRRMVDVGEKVLFVVDHQKRLIGSLTDGDIRRWFLKEGSLDVAIKKAYCTHPISVDEHYEITRIKELMLKQSIPWVPVINQKRKVKDILFWESVFNGKQVAPKNSIDASVVIMAGGKGGRLDPFTRILPKALIPIGEKAIIEIIIAKFLEYNVDEFFISVCHRLRMIKAYFEEMSPDYKITYLEEHTPLGTAGGLKALEGKVKRNLIVSNCDILIEADYSEIIEFHKKKKYDMTLVGAFRNFTIPYGVCSITNGGRLTEIREKPEQDLLVNTGMYVLKSEVLAYIPEEKHFDITDLIEKIKDHNGSVGVYPIDGKSWIDIGQWEEYQKAIDQLNSPRV